MSFLNEKVSYLKGLAEGLDIDSSTKEGKLLLAIVDVLDEMAETVEDMYDEIDDIEDVIEEIDEVIDEIDEELEELDEYVLMIDEDLSDIEDDFYGDIEDSFEELSCPECGEELLVEDSLLEIGEEIVCGNCGVIIEFVDECDLDCEDDCCDETEE